MGTYQTHKVLDLPAIDREILEFWQQEGIFERSVSEREGAPSYVFYEGPPSANGKPGIHHVLARSIKDMFCRFQTMQGKQVKRKGGWDTHGLPIELSVEKKLGITKEDIGKSISIEEYNAECRKTVMQYKSLWDDITRKMGYWVDLENPYVTYENEYIETVWFLLKRLYDKGLIYKGYTIQPYSPAAGTGLSSHELNQPGAYREVKDTSAVAQFKAIYDEKSAFLFEDEAEDVRFIAWTTTPWTLPSNTALAVGKKITYVKVKTFNPYTAAPVTVLLAKDLLGKWFKKGADALPMEHEKGNKKIPYRVVAEYPGTALEGLRYEQLLPYHQPTDGDAFRVLIGDFVSTEDGTGIVHLAPSFGADDMRVCKENGIGSLTLVDRQGRFVEGMGEFSGRYVKNYKDEADYVSVDIDISVKLKQENKAFNVQKYSHNYPHCWRTDKPVLYYPLDSWFVRATAAKDRMAELNRTINWKPASTGTGRFGAWLDNLQDWNLSRSRFWGIPLPIWRSASGEEKCIGSIEELRTEVAKSIEAGFMDAQLPEDFDMHRPYIDRVVLVSATGEKMEREADLIDVWFDSGSMPYAQWHYPFENQSLIDNALEGKDGEVAFPADFIAEGVDQTRGWFYTLHAIATMCFDSVAYKNVVSNGLVLDKHGKKMSKRLGNAVDPFETLGKYGADATRWYMITNAQPWDNLKFDLNGLDEVRRKFFGTLYNTYKFFALYANEDGFDYSQNIVPLAARPEIDRWVISLLNTLVKEVTEDYKNYEPTSAGRRIQDFVQEHLSNWYVRLCRARFWKGSLNEDKLAAYQTLYDCLITVSKLMAPISPFFSDYLFRQLNQVSNLETHDSVHLSLFPQVQEHAIDKALEQRMDYAQRISSMTHGLRKREKIRVRQPLPKILLPVLDEVFETQVDAVKDLILSEVNVKAIEYINDASGVIKKKIKPNFSTLGRRLGKDMKAAAAAIAQFSQEDIATLERTGTYELHANENSYTLTLEDFEIMSEDIEGWLVANEGALTVALDIHIDDTLRAEGLARELVHHIQNMRKAHDFELSDRIRVYVEQDEALAPVLAQFSDYICREVLALEIFPYTEGEAELVRLGEGPEVRLVVTRA